MKPTEPRPMYVKERTKIRWGAQPFVNGAGEPVPVRPTPPNEPSWAMRHLGRFLPRSVVRRAQSRTWRRAAVLTLLVIPFVAFLAGVFELPTGYFPLYLYFFFVVPVVFEVVTAGMVDGRPGKDELQRRAIADTSHQLYWVPTMLLFVVGIYATFDTERVVAVSIIAALFAMHLPTLWLAWKIPDPLPLPDED